jgi:hypothetical protein
MFVGRAEDTALAEDTIAGTGATSALESLFDGMGAGSTGAIGDIQSQLK